MTMPQAVNKVMGPIEWLLLIILSVLWGGSFFFVGVIVGALPPLTIVVLRVGLAAVALNVALVAIGRPMPNGARLWTAFFGMGFLNNVIPFCLIVWGQTHIASGLASILNATTPLFTVIVAHFLTRDEKMTAAKFAGVIAGFIGVAVMMGPDALRGLNVGILAQLAIIGAAVSYAFAAIFGRRFRSLGVAPVHTAAGQLTASSILLLPVVLFVDRPWTLPLPGADIWAAIVGLALLSTALAYILFFRVLATAGATNLLLVTFLIPVSAVLLGSGILGEQLEARHFAGMAMIGLGLAAIAGRPLRLLKSRRASPHVS